MLKGKKALEPRQTRAGVRTQWEVEESSAERWEMLEPKQTIYALLKFGEKQHLQGFRSDGLLYMKPLAEFAKLESDMARGDCFEGTTSIIQPKHVGELIFDTGKVGLGKFIGKPSDLAGPIRIGLHKTASCNVYCMFAVTRPVDGELVSSKNLEFGDSFVLVLNPTEFLGRVVRASKEAGVSYFESRLVEYYDAEEYSGETGRFRKRTMFAYQNEFRIVVEPGSDSPRKLIVGGLLDITSDVLPLSKVNQILDFSTKSAREAGVSR